MPKTATAKPPRLTTTVRTRITNESRKRLEAAATNEQRSLSSLIRLIITNWLIDQ